MPQAIQLQQAAPHSGEGEAGGQVDEDVGDLEGPGGQPEPVVVQIEAQYAEGAVEQACIRGGEQRHQVRPVQEGLVEILVRDDVMEVVEYPVTRQARRVDSEAECKEGAPGA